MRAVIQRVKKASVRVNEEVVGSISQGLLVFLGVENEDDVSDVAWLANKICGLRIFDDEEGVMNISVRDGSFEVLVISQFTLHASTKKGNRPSYMRSARPEVSEPLYLDFIQEVKALSLCKVETGIFGAMMEVELVNDGPVTILIDSRNRE